MWEAYDLGNEDFLWAGAAFMGGISGEQQAPCGAISASVVSIGLRHRCSFTDKEKVKQARNTVRNHAGKLSETSQNSSETSPAAVFWVWISPNPASTRSFWNRAFGRTHAKNMSNTSSRSFMSSRMRRARRNLGNHNLSTPRI